MISVKTVERHRANLLQKLGLRDRLELTRYAIRAGPDRTVGHRIGGFRCHAGKRDGGSVPRTGSRVLLLDHHDRVLLIHARDPDDPGHHWWELPGGGLDDGESFRAAAVRELAEETGIQLACEDLGPCVWIRESRFRYRDRDHHRIDHVFLARPPDTAPRVATTPTANERAGLIERVWFTAAELDRCPDKLLPAELPALLGEILAGRVPATPISLVS